MPIFDKEFETCLSVDNISKYYQYAKYHLVIHMATIKQYSQMFKSAKVGDQLKL